MRHKVFGKKLGRSKDERKTLFRNLVSELIMHGRIKTTEAKAKAIRPIVEKLVTKAKKATIAGTREIFGQLSGDAAQTFIDSIVPRLATRTSGFSRIIHVGERHGDNAEVVILEWVEQMKNNNEKVISKNQKEKLVKKAKKTVVKSDDKKVKAEVKEKKKSTKKRAKKA